MTSYAETGAAHLNRVAAQLDSDVMEITPLEAIRLRLEIAREYVKLAAISEGLAPASPDDGAE